MKYGYTQTLGNILRVKLIICKLLSLKYNNMYKRIFNIEYLREKIAFPIKFSLNEVLNA